MKTTHTYTQVIDLLPSELSQGNMSMIADRLAANIIHLHSELNFFTI